MHYSKNPSTKYGRQPARELITSQGRTVRWVAREIGVDYQHLSKALHGRVVPTNRIRDLLPQVLNRPLDELFTAEILAVKPRPWVRRNPAKQK